MIPLFSSPSKPYRYFLRFFPSFFITFLKSGPGTDPTGAVGRGGGGVLGGLGAPGVPSHCGSLSDGFLSRGARPLLLLAIKTLLVLSLIHISEPTRPY